MNNYYYMIWADAILQFRKHNPTQVNWQLMLFTFITWIQGLNAWIIFLWLKYFDILAIPLIDINIFPGTILDDFFTYSLEFALPFGVLNYFLIFYKEKHIKITEKYSNLKYRYALNYSFIVISGAFISAILYSVLT